MSEVEEDYSDYIKHMSNTSGSGYVLAGFTLTTLTLLINLRPEPKPSHCADHAILLGMLI